MIFKSNKLILFFSLIVFISACRDDEVMPPEEVDFLAPPAGTVAIEDNPQTAGDAAAGRLYLYEGDFEESGIPLEFFNGQGDGNILNRTGDNVNLPYNFTAVTAPNGVKVASPNCFTCHAQELNGELIIGLGNSLSDYTSDQSSLIGTLDAAILFTYGNNSPEYEAYEPFRKATLATAPQLVIPFKGPNSASKLTAVLAAHRDRESLVWLDDPAFPINEDNLPSDVPAWWLMKKKNAMFVDASARGDFQKYTMASSLLTLSDVSKAEEIYENFADVVAYLQNLEAPAYPGNINLDLAEEGERLFFENCAKCHGTYGDEETYPNLLLKAETVGTDPLYTQRNGAETNFLNWWQDGWFGTSHDAAYFDFQGGYYAPPLDGVWATAPYLHNGSVPDLATLLDSSKRPTYWSRNFNNPAYNENNTGWVYEVESEGNDPDIYDTTIPGYGNQGHYYADGFTDEQRTALIEYLKTL